MEKSEDHCDACRKFTKEYITFYPDMQDREFKIRSVPKRTTICYGCIDSMYNQKQKEINNEQ